MSILCNYTIFAAALWKATWNGDRMKRKDQQKEQRMEIFGFIVQHCQHLRLW